MKKTFRQRLFPGALVALVLVLLPTKPVLHAQNTPAAGAPLQFEVATVKPDEPGKTINVQLRVYPGGRLVIHGYALHELIAAAFAIPGWAVDVGADKWADQRRFDIEGRPPAELRNEISDGEYSNSGIQDFRVRLMLQALLVERFHLKFHIASQPGTVYLLERGKGPLRLKSAEFQLYTRSNDGTVAATDAYPTGDLGIVAGAPVLIHQTSMAQLAKMLSGTERAPVSDQTGLPGFYNFNSQTVVTNEDFQAGPPMHLLVEALPEMGLELVKTQGVVRRLIIDHAELPAGN